VPNSFVNPFLQLLYALPAVRDQALLAQVSPYHHQDVGQGSVLCELGFLFHMMRLVGEYAAGCGSRSVTSSPRVTGLAMSSVSRDTDADTDQNFAPSPLPPVTSAAAVSHKASHTTTSEGVDKVVRAANFQRVFQTLRLIPEAVALSLFDETLQSDLQQYIQVLVPFLLRQLVREGDQEVAWQNGGSSTTGTTSGRGKGAASAKWQTANNAGAAGAAPTTVARGISSNPTNNVVDDTFGFSTLSSTTFLHSGVHKVDPTHNRALMLELLYPSLCTPSTNSRRPASTKSASIKAANQPTEDTQVDVPGAADSGFTYKVTGKKSRPNASFAAVLWGSFQREVSMKGWCAETDSYEPFKKVQSLVSLPRVLALHCGNTQVDVKDSTTLAGALGETVGQGTTHANYWNHPVLITVAQDAHNKSADAADDSVDPVLHLAGGGTREFSWLPMEVEVAFRTDTEAKATESTEGTTSTSGAASPRASGGTRLLVSCRVVPYANTTPGSPMNNEDAAPVWIVYDGAKETVAAAPASQLPHYTSVLTAAEWVTQRFDLLALALQVTPPPPPPLPAHLSALNNTNNACDKKHLVLQINKSDSFEPSGWHLFNDFIVQRIPSCEVVTFPQWKHPCMVYYSQRAAVTTTSVLSLDRLAVPASVLQLESLSRTPSIRLLQSFATLPGAGDLIAFDGEFVSVSLEKSMINMAGERVVSEEGRQVLARISLLDMGHGPKDTEGTIAPGSPGNTAMVQVGAAASTTATEGPGATVFNKNMMRIIADDYILPVEPVLDYVTRFSGITEEDLNQHTSKHSLLTQRAAYLKLRYFIDAKCVFVGHGLQKDFETANIFVPPEQVR
jgi:hypothetical protein